MTKLVETSWKVSESPRKSWKVLESLGKSWKVLESLGKSWKVLESVGKYWKVLESIGKSWKVLESLRKSQKVFESLGKSWKVSESRKNFGSLETTFDPADTNIGLLIVYWQLGPKTVTLLDSQYLTSTNSWSQFKWVETVDSFLTSIYV